MTHLDSPLLFLDLKQSNKVANYGKRLDGCFSNGKKIRFLVQAHLGTILAHFQFKGTIKVHLRGLCSDVKYCCADFVCQYVSV